MNRTHRALYTTVANAIANYAGLGMSLLSIPVLLEYLGKADYGLFLTVLSFNGFFSLGTLNILGGTRILIAMANGADEDKETEIGSLFYNGLFLSFLLGGALTLGAGGYFLVAEGLGHGGLLSSSTSEKLFMLLGGQVILTVVGGNFSNLFEAMQDGYIQQIYYGIRRVVGTGLMMLTALYTQDVVLVMATNVALLLLEYALVAVHATRRYRRYLRFSRAYLSSQQLKKQVATGSKSFLYEIASLIKVSGIIWAISFSLGNELVPDFTVTRSLIFSVLAVFLSFSRSLQPAYGEAYQRQDDHWIKNRIINLAKSNLFLPFILVFLLYPAVSDVLLVWSDFNINFSQSLFLVVALYAYFNYVNQSLLLILNGVNKQKINMLYYVLDALISCGAGFLLLEVYGDIRYAILASALVSVACLPLHIRGVNRNVTTVAGLLDGAFYRKYALFLVLILGAYALYNFTKEETTASLSVITVLYLLLTVIILGVMLKQLRIFNYCIKLSVGRLRYHLYI